MSGAGEQPGLSAQPDQQPSTAANLFEGLQKSLLDLQHRIFDVTSRAASGASQTIQRLPRSLAGRRSESAPQSTGAAKKFRRKRRKDQEEKEQRTFRCTGVRAAY